jgi:hypothetical protein
MISWFPFCYHRQKVMADFSDASNDHADISSGNFQRFTKIITTGQIFPKWELREYRGDHQSISGKFQ